MVDTAGDFLLGGGSVDEPQRNTRVQFHFPCLHTVSYGSKPKVLASGLLDQPLQVI